MSFRFLRGLAACALLLFAFACKDALDAGSTAGVALYAYDATSGSVMVWDDLEALYGADSAPAPNRTLTSDLIKSKIATLGWGGLCLDSNRSVLYLVSDAGNIVRIARVRSQTGAVGSTDIVSFSLSNTGRLTNGKFGQASVDPQSDTLYVTESGDNGTQIWVVGGASTLGQDASVPLQALQTAGDSGGTGVAAGQGFVYAFFLNGNAVGPDLLTGPRLRKGSATGFGPTSVILGNTTGLGKYGTLALDYANGNLYVARHNADSAGSGAPVEVFQIGQFGLSFNQAPAYTVGTAAGQPDLRVIAHPGNKDWLVGLRGQGSVGYAVLILWKSPLTGDAPKLVSVTPSTAVLLGVALDGNAA